MRKHVPVPYTVRVCNKDFHVPGTDFVLRSGETIALPFYGIHMDPEYYPDPKKFDPERFTPEVKATRPSMTFFPFGAGPRNCPGSKFGLMVTKVAIASIIRHFNVALNSSTITPLQYDNKSFLLGIHGGIWINFSKV